MTQPPPTSATIPPTLCPTTCLCAFANAVPSAGHAFPLLLHLAHVHVPFKALAFFNQKRVSQSSLPLPLPVKASGAADAIAVL